MKRVLVLLAAYNGADWIGEQIESVLAQQAVAVTLMVRDDGSRDATPAIVAGLAAREPRVQPVAPGTPSGSASGNFFALIRGAEVSGFDAVAFCDQDDIWAPDKLARALARLDATGASGVSAAVTARWSDGRERLLAQNPVQRRADFLFEGAGQGCTFVMDAAFFRRVQDFLAGGTSAPDMHFHDWWVYLLARTWGLRWSFDPQPSMLYRQHASNEIGARGGWAAITRRLDRVRDGWYAGEVGKAGRAYRHAGGREPGLLRALDRIGQRERRPWHASVALACWLMLHGRRRMSDRAVLGASALMRWL